MGEQNDREPIKHPDGDTDADTIGKSLLEPLEPVRVVMLSGKKYWIISKSKYF